MSRFLFTTAFLLGAAAIIWMSVIFVGSDALALTITLVIGGVYTIGFVELLQYRQETAALSNALVSIPKQISVLDQWLHKLPRSLHNSVRLRIEGERVGLPAPVVTPYLVGLLVMLGLLGTFVGMVDTLKGAVLALEGTTELEAIRAGLAAPIKGLGLAFGTSVAGVAASAMLGLISTLSRRDRMLATRLLDTKISTDFRGFSLYHNRQETFKAMQVQAQSLPDVAEKLSAMAGSLERIGENLGDKLIANQDSFHESVKGVYADLASSVDKSLRENLAESGRLAGESIKPIVKEVMAEINKEAQNTHQHLTRTAQEQLEVLTGRFTQTSEDVTHAWKAGLAAHENSNINLIDGMSSSFDKFNEQFTQVTENILASFDKTSSTWVERQTAGDKERLELWSDSLEQSQHSAASQLEETAKLFVDELRQVTNKQQSSFQTAAQDFESLSAALAAQWREAGAQALLQQKRITDSVEQTAKDITNNASSTSTSMLGEMATLLSSSEQLIKTRIESEADWREEHSERMMQLTSAIKAELETLRSEEALRGQAAVERLAGLESAVASHLATLGKELEEPMTHLIQTASETPRAAAEVIGHLRREISNNIERDNSLLEERSRIMEDLNTLSSSLAQASTGQREAIEMLVNSSEDMLKGVSQKFSEHIETEASKMAAMAENFAGSATEMSSLGEAFGLAVHLFNESNVNLIDHLSRIEESMDKSSSRSDEQMGYYVAQAREIIDHSMLSQKEVFEELRQLSEKEEVVAKQVVSEEEVEEVV